MLYLLAPFLVIRSQRDMTAAVLVSLFFFALTQWELHGVKIYMLNSGIGFLTHLPYFFLGSALYHINKKIPLRLPALLFLLSTACIAFGTYCETAMAGEFLPGWYQKSTGWLAIMQASAIFLFVCQLIPRIQPHFKPEWRRQMLRFAKATFGIYIYHVAVVELLYPTLLRQGFSHISVMGLTAIGTFLLTGGVVLFLQRSRTIRRWV